MYCNELHAIFDLNNCKSQDIEGAIRMETKDYFGFLVNEIHTAVVATVDDEGLPVTAAIDMMDHDENSLYFLTAKGKGFYDRLVKRGFLAFTAPYFCS